MRLERVCRHRIERQCSGSIGHSGDLWGAEMKTLSRCKLALPFDESSSRKGVAERTSYSGVNRFVRAVMVTSGSAPVELLKCGLCSQVAAVSWANASCTRCRCQITSSRSLVASTRLRGRREVTMPLADVMGSGGCRLHEGITLPLPRVQLFGQIRYRMSRSSLGRRRKNNRTESRRLKCIDQWFCDTRLKHWFLWPGRLHKHYSSLYLCKSKAVERYTSSQRRSIVLSRKRLPIPSIWQTPSI
jgi:hypothetical protein